MFGKWQLSLLFWLSAMLLAAPAMSQQLDLTPATPTLGIAHIPRIQGRINEADKPAPSQWRVTTSQAHEASGSRTFTDHYSHEPIHYVCNRQGMCRDISTGN